MTDLSPLPPLGPDDPPAYEEKDGADLPADDQALPEAPQTPVLDGDDEDVDLAESPDVEIEGEV